MSLAFTDVHYEMPLTRSHSTQIIGCDFSGVIVQAGDDVAQGLKVGDHVAGMVHVSLIVSATAIPLTAIPPFLLPIHANQKIPQIDHPFSLSIIPSCLLF